MRDLGLGMCVVGGGTMGVGIAYVHAAAGWHVWLVEPNEGRRGQLPGILAAAAQSGRERGRLDDEQFEAVTRGIRILPALGGLPRDLHLAIETVPEIPALKEKVLAELDSLGPGLIGTNTSSISIDRLACCVRDPSRFLGMHFFNPVWSLPMVELVRGEKTSSATLDLAREYAESTGKTTVVSRDMPGFATSRLDVLMAMEAIRMVEDGVASAADIDKGMVTAFRHPVGPLRLTDIVGLDVRLDIATYLAGALGDRFAPPKLLREMVARGDLGVKSGRGFFDWSETRAFISSKSGKQ